MELKKWNGRIKSWGAKYKYALAVLLLGIVLMLLPTQKQVTEENTKEVQPIEQLQLDIEEELSSLLSSLEGAGRVKVMLAVAEGELTLYQTDRTDSQSEGNVSSKTQTILISDSQRNQNGLIYQKNPPVYRGAVVLAQGAQNPSVRLAIVDAVGKATGLGADKIAVLKMK